MLITVSDDGRETVSTSVEQARGLGYAPSVIEGALRHAAARAIAAEAEAVRATLAPMSAGKLATYYTKASIAADPDGASEDELALIDRIAAARGQARDNYLAFCLALEAAMRRAALIVDAEMEEAQAAARLAEAGTLAELDVALEAIVNDAAASLRTAAGKVAQLLTVS